MTDFSRAERADDMLGSLVGFVHRTVQDRGTDYWNNSSDNARTRARASRLASRLSDRREAAIDGLAAAGTPRRVTRDHLARRRARALRSRS
jgi:hypothetical protein